MIAGFLYLLGQYIWSDILSSSCLYFRATKEIINIIQGEMTKEWLSAFQVLMLSPLLGKACICVILFVYLVRCTINNMGRKIHLLGNFLLRSKDYFFYNSLSSFI